MRLLHRFPKCPELQARWMENINMNVQKSLVYKSSMRLCSDHFEGGSYNKVEDLLQLKKESIPTIFPDHKSVCVYCGVETNLMNEKRSFHRFPLKDRALLLKWVNEMKIEGFVPSPKSRLCSSHFKASCFTTSKKFRLKNDAIPTIFLHKNRKGKKRPYSPDHSPTSSRCSSSKVLCRRDDSPEITHQSIIGAKDSLENTQQTVSLTENSLEFPQPTFVLTENRPRNDEQTLSPKIHQQQDFQEPVQSSQNSPKNTQENIFPTESGRGNVRNSVDESTHCDKSSEAARHDHRYETTPRSSKRKLTLMNQKMQTMKAQLKSKGRKITRLKKKVETLKDIVSHLRKTRALPESGLACLDSIADTDVSQFLKRFEKNAKMREKEQPGPRKRLFKAQRGKDVKKIYPCKEKYPAALRSFAMTLHFYSPKAYGFVRNKFCNALPDTSTLRSWYSAIDGEPGFTSESFEALKLKVSESLEVEKQILVALVADEVGIKKGLTISQNRKVRGQVDIGNGMETSDSVPLAKNALVMMVVVLDGSWKIPIGYFLINGIDSSTNSDLIKEALIRLHNIDVKAVSVTLDGTSEHFATMRLLGANFTMPNPLPHFPHPITKEDVHVILDACHMLKLFRNCLGDYGTLLDAKGNEIRWDLIKSLAELQEQEGLRAGNKLRMSHIQYRKMKMKVSLAAQTLSSSVADAIEFCAKIGIPEFQKNEATVRFIRCIDRLFDFLNSRNPFGKGFKSPLRRSNENFLRSSILSEIEYLKGITDLNSVPMWKTRRQVAFVGMITAVISVIAIFDSYVKPIDSPLKYLLTYKLSQDHIELFFAAIRCCGGWCPNPTCAQFISAYKRLLVHHQVKSVNENCESMECTKILTVPSGSAKRSKVDHYNPSVYDVIANIRVAKKYGLDQNEDEREVDELFNEFHQVNGKLSPNLPSFSRSTIAYIGGWVVRKLIDKRRPVVSCEECQKALVQETPMTAEFEDNCLILAKTRGGLIFPSKSVVEICLRTETLFRHCLNKIGFMPPTEANFPAVLCCKVMQEVFRAPYNIFSALNNHLFDDAIDEPSHTYLLTKHVCTTYIKLRLFSVTKKASESAIGEKLRHHMTRQIIWKHQ